MTNMKEWILVAITVFLEYQDLADCMTQCVIDGGTCKSRHYGCEGGYFEEDLCDGPYTYQCCKLHPKVDLEALNRPKWRMCHKCSYSVADQNQLGELDCYLWEKRGADLHTINCTGMCTKEFLKLDANNFELVRRCSNDCHEDSSNKLHSVNCCWGNLCNAANAKGGGSFITVIMATIATILLWPAWTGKWRIQGFW